MPTSTLQKGTRRATASTTGSIQRLPVRRASAESWFATMCLATRPMTYATAMTRMESSAVRAEAGQPWRSQFIDARSYDFGSGSAMPDDDKRVHGDVDGKRHAAEHQLIGARQAVGIED